MNRGPIRFLLLFFLAVGLGTGVYAFWRAVTAPQREMAGLVKRLRSADSDLPYVLQKLADIGPPAVPVLIEALEPGNVDRQGMAAHALGLIGDARALEPLCNLALGTTDKEVRRACVMAIATIHDSKALATLEELSMHSASEMRAEVATAVGGCREGVAILQRLLSDSDSRVRAKAVVGVGLNGFHFKRNRRRAAGLLKSMVNDPSAEVRESVATSLGWPPLVEYGALEAVAACIGDDAPRVRAAAAESLGKIGSQDAVTVLSAVAKDEVPEVRAAVIGALGSIGGEESMRIASAAAKDPDPRVREVAGMALAELGSSDGIRILEDLLNSEKLEVRTRAIHALGRVGSPEAVAVLERLVREGDFVARESAGSVLDLTDRPIPIPARPAEQ